MTSGTGQRPPAEAKIDASLATWPRTMRRLLVLLALAGTTLAGAAPPVAPPAAPLPSIELPEELARVLRDYEQAWQAGRPSELARLFTPAGLALPNGQPPRRGAAEIAAGYTDGAGMPLALRALAYRISGDLAHVVGGYAPQPGRPDMGKFVLVLERGADGRWLIAADIDNLNALPRRAPSSPASPTGVP